MRLTGETRAVASLAPDERERMFALMDMHFEGMARERFERDLAEKEWVLLGRAGAGGTIQGFSTIRFIDTDYAGQPVRAIYSGDTIINKEFWGDRIFGQLWLGFVLKAREECPDRRVFWFLISMGYKTYRMLQLFFVRYWPRHDAETPAFERGLIDHLGQLKFGPSYDAARGVVTFSGHRERLRPGVADVDHARLKDPDVLFFVERNPGHANGDELACVAEVHPDNVEPRMWRIFNLPRRG